MIILLIFFLIKGFDLEYLVQRVQCTSHIANNQCHERYFPSAESCKTSWGAPQLLFSLLVLRLWITHQNLSIVCLHSCLHYLQTVTFNLWLLGLISWLISLSVCSFPAAAAESQTAVFSHLSVSYQISEPIQLPCQTFHLENIYFNLILENFPQIYSFHVYIYMYKNIIQSFWHFGIITVESHPKGFLILCILSWLPVFEKLHANMHEKHGGSGICQSVYVKNWELFNKPQLAHMVPVSTTRLVSVIPHSVYWSCPSTNRPTQQ